MKKILLTLLCVNIFIFCTKQDDYIPKSDNVKVKSLNTGSIPLDTRIQINEILRTYSGKDFIGNDAILATDLGFDANDLHLLMVVFNDKFDLKMEKFEILSLKTVSDLYNLISKLLEPRIEYFHVRQTFPLPINELIHQSIDIDFYCTIKYATLRSAKISDVIDIKSVASPDIYIERAANGDTILLNKLIYKPIKSTYEKDSKIIVWKAELSTTIINDNKTTSFKHDVVSRSSYDLSSGNTRINIEFINKPTPVDNTGGQIPNNPPTTFNRLIQIISEHTSVSIERISPESNFVSDLEMDELTCYELFMGVEEEFSIEIPDENREVILTVNDLYQYLVENL